MFAIYEIVSGARFRRAHGFPQLRDAIAYARQAYQVAHLEVDPDEQIEAADFITRAGKQFCIEHAERAI